MAWAARAEAPSVEAPSAESVGKHSGVGGGTEPSWKVPSREMLHAPQYMRGTGTYSSARSWQPPDPCRPSWAKERKLP